MTGSQIHPIYLRVTREGIALIKFLFESYEEVGIVRTLDRGAAVIVVLVCCDFLPVARGILESLREQTPIEEIPPPPDAGQDWLLKLLMQNSES